MVIIIIFFLGLKFANVYKALRPILSSMVLAMALGLNGQIHVPLNLDI
jgi:hypothetical protein